MAQAIETRSAERWREAALKELQGEFGLAFDLLRAHERTLVGKTVPSLNKDGTEVLRDSQDAKEYQEALKAVLGDELNARIETQREAAAPDLEVLQNSVEMFRKNRDMIPGVQGFDRELTDKVMAVARHYEVRKDGKLQGFSLNMQPLIDTVRAELKASRAKAPAPPAKPAAKAPAPPADPPQQGLKSVAGQRAHTGADDVADLFGTLGITGLRL